MILQNSRQLSLTQPLSMFKIFHQSKPITEKLVSNYFCTALNGIFLVASVRHLLINLCAVFAIHQNSKRIIASTHFVIDNWLFQKGPPSHFV